jgi:iron(III) transport system substrate-binding protein
MRFIGSAAAAAAVAACLGLACLIAAPAPAEAQGGSPAINVHTTREKGLIEPLLRVFEGLSRRKVEVVYLTGDPLPRLKQDAAAGKVDLFIASEFSQLVAAKDNDLTETAGGAEFAGRIPEAYRDPDGHWFGLSMRLRVVAASRERVKQTAFTYEELAEPKWKGKVCVRSGLHPYNVGLVASLISHKGGAFAEAWLRGVKANLAMKPAGGDRDQVANVHAGKCDVALVNSYYIGALSAANDKPMQAAAGAVKVVFPNAADRGTHVSIAGMALMKDAPAINDAALLMDFLTSEPAQFISAQDNHEYPARDGVKPSDLVASWGTPKLDDVPLSTIAELQDQAAALIRKVGFDNGPGS